MGKKQKKPFVIVFCVAVPEHIEDDIVGSINFCEQFTLRYGSNHPSFYEGTLDDAMKEACNKPAKDVKL